MKTLLRSLIVAASLLASAVQAEDPVEPEFAAMLRVVEDKDGFTNVRAGASLESKVVEKALTGSVVCVQETKGDWAEIADDSGKGRDLYVHTSRLKPVKEWKQTAGKAAKANDSGTVKSGGLEAKVTEVPFVAKDHKITEVEGQKQVDGRLVWGTDGELPKKAMKLEVTLDGKAVTLPAKATHDLYEPDPAGLAILTPGKPGTQAFIYMHASDGAGAYAVVWSFKEGKYVGRTVFGTN